MSKGSHVNINKKKLNSDEFTLLKYIWDNPFVESFTMKELESKLNWGERQVWSAISDLVGMDLVDCKEGRKIPLEDGTFRNEPTRYFIPRDDNNDIKKRAKYFSSEFGIGLFMLEREELQSVDNNLWPLRPTDRVVLYGSVVDREGSAVFRFETGYMSKLQDFKGYRFKMVVEKID